MQLWVVENLVCIFRVNIRVFENADAEEAGENPLCRCLPASAGTILAIFLHPYIIGLHDLIGKDIASHLVHTCIKNLEYSFSNCHILDSVALTMGRERIHIVVRNYSPVRTYNSFETVCLS